MKSKAMTPEQIAERKRTALELIKTTVDMLNELNADIPDENKLPCLFVTYAKELEGGSMLFGTNCSDIRMAETLAAAGMLQPCIRNIIKMANYSLNHCALDSKTDEQTGRQKRGISFDN